MTPYLFAAVAAGIVAGIASAALPWFVALPMGLCVAQVVDGLIRARNRRPLSSSAWRSAKGCF